ncbi:hypothetical protein B0T20DRAFT_419231 [Sordaria brevicollis]|uniref:HIT-type domain-containing protein n=1 Tax=Sordaria brevicollis TaxID=83679 RepID=A0AAE0P930_SORBR|nr:hypothetical protein B0T20DRAFT_419231 [Sordaria brevicollis]
MNNFGVVEVASQKTKNAPGWAYVPDTGLTPAAAAALQPLNRKRAARDKANVVGAPDLTARQDAKIRKDLEALDKDSHRDAQIPIPPRAGGTRAQNKHTPNVRKILQSQKTFGNHLDDYQAFLALAESNPQLAAQVNKPTPTTTARNSPAPSTITTASTNKRSSVASKRAAAAAKEEKSGGSNNKRSRTQAQQHPKQADDDDLEMTDAPEPTTAEPVPVSESSEPRPDDTPAPLEPELSEETEAETESKPQSYPPDGTILPAYNRPPPAAHPGDDDPLLVSRVPPFPTDEELRALMTAPPLSYLEARAQWDEDEGGRYPVRRFCEVCGYWGRVKCIKCGARVCALECLETHREECLVRYGL